MPEVRLRFSIRDLFWLTLVVALAVGWWIEHTTIRNKQALLDQNSAESQSQTIEFRKKFDNLSKWEAQLKRREAELAEQLQRAEGAK